MITIAVLVSTAIIPSQIDEYIQIIRLKNVSYYGLQLDNLNLTLKVIMK
jgi:hypothetical protein